MLTWDIQKVDGPEVAPGFFCAVCLEPATHLDVVERFSRVGCCDKHPSRYTRGPLPREQTLQAICTQGEKCVVILHAKTPDEMISALIDSGLVKDGAQGLQLGALVYKAWNP